MLSFLLNTFYFLFAYLVSLKFIFTIKVYLLLYLPFEKIKFMNKQFICVFYFKTPISKI